MKNGSVLRQSDSLLTIKRIKYIPIAINYYSNTFILLLVIR